MIQFEHSEGQREHSHPHRNSSNKYLKELPEFKHPQKIQAISYPKNMISKIRSSICKAVNMHTINLSHNKITSIQPLFEIKNLKVLNLSYNMICSIGVGIGKLNKLETVDVGYNLLGTMNSIRGLVKLWQIREGNVGIILEGNEVIKRQKQSISNIFTLKNIQNPCTKEEKQQDTEKSQRNTSLKNTGKLHKTMMRENKNKIEQIQTAKHKKDVNQGSKNLDVSMILPVFPSDYSLSEASHQLKKQDSSKNKSASLLLLDSSSILPSSSSYQINKNMNSKGQTNGQNYLQILKELRNKNNVNKKQEQKSSFLQCEESKNSKMLSMDQEYGKNLEQIKQKLQILLNTCCNKWHKSMFSLLKEQSQAIDVYVQIHIAILDHSRKDVGENIELQKVKNSLEEHISQSEEIKEIIKTSHKQLLEMLGEQKDTPVKVYRIWVNLVRDLHNVCSVIVKDAWNCLMEIDRRKELESLQKLSPDKNTHRMIIKSLETIHGVKRNKSKELRGKRQNSNSCRSILGSPSAPINKSNEKYNSDLQVLLFSNNKKKKGPENENSNTVEKNKNFGVDSSNEKSENNERMECDQCFMKDGQIKYLKQVLDREMENSRKQQQEMNSLHEKMEKICQNMNALGQRNKDLEERAVGQQHQIIRKLDQNITAGVYQDVLLMQALGVEDLIKSGCVDYVPISENYSKQVSFSNGKTQPLLKKNIGSNQINPNSNQWGYQTDRNNKNMGKQNRISYFSHQTSQSNGQKSQTDPRKSQLNSITSDVQGRVRTFESNDDYSCQNKEEKSSKNNKWMKVPDEEKQNVHSSSFFGNKGKINEERIRQEISPISSSTTSRNLHNLSHSVSQKNQFTEKNITTNQQNMRNDRFQTSQLNRNADSYSQKQKRNSNEHANQILTKWNSTTTAGRTTSPLSGINNSQSHIESEKCRQKSPLSGTNNTRKIKDKKQKNNISTKVGCMTIAEEQDEKDQIIVSDFAVLTQSNKQNGLNENKRGENNIKVQRNIHNSQSSANNFLDRYNHLNAYKPPEKFHDKEPYSQYISHHLRNQIMHTLLSKKSGVQHNVKKPASFNIRSDPLLKNNQFPTKSHKLQYNSLPKQKVDISVEQSISLNANRRNLSLSLDSKTRNVHGKDHLNSLRGNKKPRYIKA